MQKIKTWFIDEKTVYIPRLWQIIITCLIVSALILTFIKPACTFGGANWADAVNAWRYNLDASTIRVAYTSCSVYDVLPIVLVILEFLSFVLCMLFVWRDKPKKAFCSSLLFLVFPVAFVYSYNYFKVDGYDTQYRAINSVGILYILLSVAIVLIAFIMTKRVKEGSRPLKQVEVVNIAKSNTSSMDELLKLKDLLDKEIITQEEYITKRDELVSRL